MARSLWMITVINMSIEGHHIHATYQIPFEWDQFPPVRAH